nr:MULTISPECIES: DUF3265 domain-containing protein [unclassified Vibrio]
MTSCLRVIRNVRYFYYASVYVFKIICGG